MFGETKPQNLTIEEMGKEGEERARLLLKSLGYTLTKPDWIGEKDGQFTQFEIKMKAEPFTAGYCGKKWCEFTGHGLDIYQLERRLRLQNNHNLPCEVIIFEKEPTNIYRQSLNKLELGKRFNTPNNIRIYPLDSYERL